MNKFVAYFKLARLNQWLKNSFVMAGFIFNGVINDTNLLIKALMATFAFCLASSAIYAFNDSIDSENDILHTEKKFRPVASGQISVKAGIIFSIFLCVISLIFSFTISIKLFLLIFCYFILNILYTFHLKHIVIVDVFCIALGFMLRVIAGTYAINIPPSNWIILCSMMISLFLGFGKRYSETSTQHHGTRTVLSLYEENFLSLFLGISCACTIMSYSLYTINQKTILSHGTDKLFITIPLVIFALFRYLYIVLSLEKGSNPSKEIFSDNQILITVILYVMSIFIILY